MEVVVLGAGSLGSLVGGLLAREHRVTLVGRDPHVSAVERDGLRVVGEVEREVNPRATTDGTGLSGDLAIVTVKAFDTPEAARVLATGSFRTTLSLQNGMGNESALTDALDSAVLAGTASYGAVLREPGLVECTGIGEVAIGPPGGGESPVAERVGAAFRESGIGCEASMEMPRRLWEKLAVNAAINPVTALSGAENGAVIDGPLAPVAEAAARETAAVARDDGIDLPEERTLDAFTRVAGDTARNTSSMAQDVANGSETEIDAINGYVVDRANGPVPVNETLTALVRGWEREKGLR
ncbi:ketopantoate reductase family protein [Natronorarus salvus]|uniref:ketopantoate reductase family protein n=1 Tax=Natronorarus salvus TaxID=3117733 RepID=UPI002F261A4A